VFDCLGGNPPPPPPERNTAWNKGRKCFHCLGAPNNLIRPCTQDAFRSGRGECSGVSRRLCEASCCLKSIVRPVDGWCTAGINSKVRLAQCHCCGSLHLAPPALSSDSTPWEADISSANQEIYSILWNQMVHDSIHNSPAHVPIPKEMNLALAILSWDKPTSWIYPDDGASKPPRSADSQLSSHAVLKFRFSSSRNVMF